MILGEVLAMKVVAMEVETGVDNNNGDGLDGGKCDGGVCRGWGKVMIGEAKVWGEPYGDGDRD